MTIAPATLDELKRRAREASARAYAPYSAFPVGAAALCDGVVYTGANVENASFGLSVCAERAAIFTAIGAGARRIEAMALYALTASPATPCGACLQVIAEFGPEAVILCCGEDDRAERRYVLKDLLPAAFASPSLGAKR